MSPGRSAARSPVLVALLLFLLEQLKEAVFQGLVARRNLEHLAAEADDRGHQLGHAVGLEVGKGELVALVIDVSEACETGLVRLAKARHADLDSRSAQPAVP